MSAAGRRFLLARDAAPAGEPGRGASAASHTVPRAAGTPRRLTMLTHGWCHLCDDMRAALAPIAALHGLAVVEIDIDTDPTLGAAYAERVPVLFAGDVAGGREICCGRLDRAALATALADKPEIR